MCDGAHAKPNSQMNEPSAEMPLLLVAAVALIDADNRVLIAQRPAGKTMAGLWEFPGGKVEGGERPEETLIRELDEELGITVKEECLAPLTFASHAYEELPSADAALRLPALGRLRAGARGPGAEMGSGQEPAGLPDASRRRAARSGPDRSPRLKRDDVSSSSSSASLFEHRSFCITKRAGKIPALFACFYRSKGQSLHFRMRFVTMRPKSSSFFTMIVRQPTFPVS